MPEYTKEELSFFKRIVDVQDEESRVLRNKTIFTVQIIFTIGYLIAGFILLSKPDWIVEGWTFVISGIVIIIVGGIGFYRTLARLEEIKEERRKTLADPKYQTFMKGGGYEAFSARFSQASGATRGGAGGKRMTQASAYTRR